MPSTAIYFSRSNVPVINFDLVKIPGTIVAAVYMALLAVQPADAQIQDTPTCAESIIPSYNPLAKAARIQGTVKVHFEVTSEGTATNIVNESGHPILLDWIDSLLRAGRFDPKCAGRLDMVYTFVFTDQVESGTTVSFNAPNEYVVTAAEISCRLRSTTVQRSLFRRFLDLFH